MNKNQIDKIKALDKDGLDGSIQSLLLRSDLSQVQFSDACRDHLEAIELLMCKED